MIRGPRSVARLQLVQFSTLNLHRVLGILISLGQKENLDETGWHTGNNDDHPHVSSASYEGIDCLLPVIRVLIGELSLHWPSVLILSTDFFPLVSKHEYLQG